MQIQPNSNVTSTVAINNAAAIANASHVKSQPTAESGKVAGQNQANTPNPVAQGKPTAEEINDATEKLQKFVETVRSDIQFSVDEESGRNIVKVVDKQTKDVLMQFPSEEALAISKSLDKFQGLFIKQQA